MEVTDPDGTDCAAFVVAQHTETLDEPWHASRRLQLLHACDGVLTVRTENGLWVIPPQHALWIAPGLLFRLSSSRPLAWHTLYVDTDDWPSLPDALPGRVVAIDRLADALLRAAARFGADYAADGPDARLMRVLLDRLPQLAAVPLALAYPRDPRIQRIAGVLTTHPADPTVLDDHALAAGVTARTAARLFVKETGQTFGQWRQQLRLLVALERLDTGASVTEVALEVGYSDVSSFIAVFKDLLGETPARYFRQDGR
ncbi:MULTISPECIES: helix-turn-helix domain-containing protein [Paraburkholderia]|uniref:AraC family transcriptional regulator n=1 Tax=Paraburkholderia TaxID=1822464 RepID=UPI0022578FFC|nr:MULTISPECIES: helix-turn-helix transcriptional regulator [Paraburkholderia]MCX4161359.1 helix-turn-helix transcriptional regulator [Paraburkholderia megapolitana]MDN7156855.1 helix-turn-helix transcriptional regulator [Paraburkholderia sp. CHISQ3]MDQ6493900.1 helix-turn-helix transcriptional regulator [Paraburkholderia megapolitana]